jgi:hypothetical protein
MGICSLILLTQSRPSYVAASGSVYSLTSSLQLLAEQRHYLAVVTDNSEPAMVEDGRFGIGIDRGDILSVRNTCHMLARATDTNR